ncbi:MAG TPA: c-type cytochrome [Thermoanaerobaculia bacterium]
MRIFLAIIVAVVLVVALGMVLIVKRGAGAREQPTVIEERLGRTLRHFAIPASLRIRKNPVPDTPDVIAAGRAHWADHCAVCHANDGSGNTEIGRNLYPRSPDMRKATTQELSDGELFAIIRDGVRLTGMPAWRGNEADNWKLVRFIRHLPRITQEEIDEMERLNPKSPAEMEEMHRENEFLHGH